jgi:Ubiquitin-conjugating enzyme
MPRIHRFAGYETKLSSDDQILTMATGPYEPAVIRFHISFPSQYPDHPPLVTFATDLFHPLLVPLTTYTFSTSARNTTETVSASDEERLPPGGFSLRNGFPRWFRRQSKVAGEVMGSTARHHDSGAYSGAAVGSRDVSTESASVLGSEHQAPPFLLPSEAGVKTTGINEILDYMKSAFENPAMLDKLPLEAAGNPGAWHAWRSHRGLSMATGRAISPTNDGASILPADGSQTLPSDWNWEGVWENRVRDGIQTSLSDPILFAPKSGRGGERKAEIVSIADKGMCLAADHHRYDSQRWMASS